MKLVAILVSLGLAAPALACPNMDHDQTQKTAEKSKAKSDDSAKAKDQPKQDKSKDQKTPTKTAKDGKKGDKVSLN